MPQADADLEMASRQADDSEDETSGLRVAVPSSMKMLDDAGNIVTVPLSTGGDVNVCCGCPRPPGGWYGPFGFFRLISVVFMVLSAGGMVLAVLAVFHADAVAVVGSLVLAFAAGMCALAAYAHEGMARQVSEMGRLNEAYAEKNERLAVQVKSLGGVEQQLENIQTSMGMGLDELMSTISTMHRLTSTQQLTTILQAFTDADKYGTADQVLKDREVDVFFNASRGLLEDAAPGFDIDKLQVAISKSGLGIDQVRLIINAVVAGGDDTPGRSEAELWLLMCSLAPTKANIEKCTDALKRVLPSKTPDEIKATLQKSVEEEDTNGDERDPLSKVLLGLSKEVMTAS